MMTTTSMRLPDDLVEFAQDEVIAGRYASVGELVRALLERERDERRKERFLERALREGMESGPGRPARAVFGDLRKKYPWLRGER